MGRRAATSELDFGSDSFLDIIANIVGILIILMVVAGLRVSRAPVVTEPVAEAPPPVNAVPLPPAPPAVIMPSPELFTRVQSLRSELEALAVQQADGRDELNRIGAQGADIRRNKITQSALLERETERLKLATQRAERVVADVRDSQKLLAELQSQLRQAEHQKPPVKQLKHRMTPLSRTVNGHELHFRLAAGHVAVVPIDDLLSQLRLQMERQKQWLTKFRRHQGSVGPIKGFSMSYVVERQRLSSVEQLRYGRTYMRIGISQWKLEPQPDLKGESAEQALRPGSEFFVALVAADPKTALTFWVYPDSFDLFRRLQQFAHAQDFTVAARPLPFGIPIAGSPRGTKSSGQ